MGAPTTAHPPAFRCKLHDIRNCAVCHPEISAEAQKVKLFEEPEEDILVLGYMARDAKTMSALLNGLPFAEDYRGTLRIIRGCAERMRLRTAKLLGEV